MEARVDVDDHPYEAGLDRLVDLEQGDFVGRDALLSHRKGTGAMLVGLTMAAAGIWMWGDEPVLHDEQAVALTVGGGYGYRVGRLIALSYPPVELASPGTSLAVEVLGARVPCQVAAMPMHGRAAANSKDILHSGS